MALAHVTVQFGTELKEAHVEADMSVGTLLRQMNLEDDGYIVLNGRDCDLGDGVHDGDLIRVTPKAQKGGRN